MQVGYFNDSMLQNLLDNPIRREIPRGAAALNIVNFPLHSREIITCAVCARRDRSIH